jgi:hypothetical protein
MILRMKLVTWAGECGCSLAPDTNLFTLSDNVIEGRRTLQSAKAAAILMPRRRFVVKSHVCADRPIRQETDQCGMETIRGLGVRNIAYVLKNNCLPIGHGAGRGGDQLCKPAQVRKSESLCLARVPLLTVFQRGGGGSAGEAPASAARCSLCFFFCSIDARCLLMAKPTVPPMMPMMIKPAIGTQRGKGSGEPSSRWASTCTGKHARPAV